MITWVPKKTINVDRIQSLLQSSIDSNQYTNNGPNVKILEDTIHSLLKISPEKSVICVANGTVALWAAVAALEIYHNKNLQFCTQSFTFPASAQGYLQNVKIIDIDEEGGLDIGLIDKDTCDGIIVTNVFGNIVNIDKYTEWSKKYNKFLIFDNAATSYTFYNGINSCNYGDISTVSFHHTKPIGFGEGGCIILDKKYERILRNVINFGIDNTIPNGIWNTKGGNYKMSDIQAVYINQYLDNFQTIVNYSCDLYTYFKKKYVGKCDHIVKLFPNFSSSTPFVSCLPLLSSKSNDIILLLKENGIYSRKYYTPLSNTDMAVKFFNDITCISFHKDMTTSDIDLIIDLISTI